MKPSWVIEVLDQLKAFALRDDLPVLAEQLDDTIALALVEIANRDWSK